jgi:hypothetical protein
VNEGMIIVPCLSPKIASGTHTCHIQCRGVITLFDIFFRFIPPRTIESPELLAQADTSIQQGEL